MALIRTVYFFFTSAINYLIFPFKRIPKPYLRLNDMLTIINQRGRIRFGKDGQINYSSMKITIVDDTRSFRWRHADIGAESMVSKDVSAREIWAGNPARFIRPISSYGN